MTRQYYRVDRNGLGQLKTEKGERDCCQVIFGAPTTFKGYGIEQNERIDRTFSALFCQPVLMLRFLTTYNTLSIIQNYCERELFDMIARPVNVRR